MLFNNLFIEKLAARAPESIALVEKNGATITCGQLYSESLRLAAHLQKNGAQRRQSAVIAAEPSADFVRIIYAAMLLDWEIAIIDPDMGRENFKTKLDQFDPHWAFIDYRLLLLQEHPILRAFYFLKNPNGIYLPMRKGMRLVGVGNWLPIVRRHLNLKKMRETPVNSPELTPADMHSPFLITYTSGTLATPKGVVHSLATLAESIKILANILSVKRDDGQAEIPQRLATHLPHYLLIGVNAEITIYLWDNKAAPSKKLVFIEKNNITTLFNPPSDYLPLMQEALKNKAESNEKSVFLGKNLQHVLFGSAPVHAAFLSKIEPLLPPNCRLTALYGMTENLLVTMADGREKMQRQEAGDWLGYPLPNVRLQIADDAEIFLQSPQLFLGYYQLPAREAWHATGDSGRLNADGSLTLIGRKKDMIIRRHFNIYPALYEPTINKIKGVSDAALVGVFDEKAQDEKVFLIIEKEENHPLSISDVEKQISQGRLAIDKEALPDVILFRKLPRKGRQNKIDKVRLRTEII
ncbi:MAG: class I adenylate-forming enzyme family protein [Bacteroidota bacterium]